MKKNFYTVELIFDPEDASTCAGVRSFLEGFGHLTPNRIEAAISKGKILLKRHIGYREAKTILQRIRIDGAKCHLKKQPHALPDNTDTVDHKATKRDEAKAAAKDVVCPKCRTRQLDTGECRHCGVIYSKINDSYAPKVRLKTVENVKREKEKSTLDILPDGTQEKRLPFARKLIGWMTGWRRDIYKLKKQYLSTLIDCGILFLTALIMEIALLSLSSYLWFILSSTEAGTHFLQTHPEKASLIQAMLGSGVVALSISVVLWVLIINLLSSFFARVIYFDRWYLDSDSVVVKTIWILASTLLSALVICRKELCPSLLPAFVISLPPTFCLVKCCLKLAKSILPETGSIITGFMRIQSNLGNLIAVVKKR